MPVLRLLLLPFSFLYQLITDFRNYLYEIGNKKSIEFDQFVIGVGNLTVGGTGKTPFVELLVKKLKDETELAVVSRGYKRKTRGFRLANEDDDASSIGDEPFQYYLKFKGEVAVAVGEDRVSAVTKLLSLNQSIKTIILDDAYQHRAVKPSLNILLNDYSRPFFKDYLMPGGLLRESRKGASRADIVVVTKCPDELGAGAQAEIEHQIGRYAGGQTPIFFTGIKYQQPIRLFGNKAFTKNVFLFSGIANSQPLLEYAKAQFNLLGFMNFRDHHSYSAHDLKDIVERFDKIGEEHKCIVTTEKDMARLVTMKEEARFLIDQSVFYLPIELYFLGNGDFFTSYLNELLEERMTNTDFK